MAAFSAKDMDFVLWKTTSASFIISAVGGLGTQDQGPLNSSSAIVVSKMKKGAGAPEVIIGQALGEKPEQFRNLSYQAA
jgi:hypothetical protein